MNGASTGVVKRRNYRAERERAKDKVHPNTGRKWSAHQHAAFRRTMKKIWKEKRAAEKEAAK